MSEIEHYMQATSRLRQENDDLRRQLAEAQAERDGWQEDARRYAQNADHWQDRVERLHEQVSEQAEELKHMRGLMCRHFLGEAMDPASPSGVYRRMVAHLRERLARTQRANNDAHAKMQEMAEAMVKHEQRLQAAQQEIARMREEQDIQHYRDIGI